MKKRLLSITLAVALIAGCFSIAAFAAESTDITADVTMVDLGNGISADTITIGVKLGSYSCLPESGVGYFINDNPTSNGIDPLSYFEINGVNARSIVSANQAGTTSYAGTAFPMNIGGIYSPVLAFCEQGYIRFSILTDYLPARSYTLTLKSGFSWTNNTGDILAVTSDVSYYFDSNNVLTKAVTATGGDITSEVTMEDIGGGIAGTTTIAVKLGSYSCLPESGVGYFINDNPTSNGIDPLSYFEINGVSGRKIVSDNQNGVTAFAGEAFPMNIGGVYSPVLAFCEQGYIRFSVLNAYLPQGSYTVTLKSGFSWKNSDGYTLSVSEDITYAYNKDGGFAKVTPVESNGALSVANYLPDNANAEYTYIDICSTNAQFTGYDYKFFDSVYGNSGFVPYLALDGKTLAEINATDISGYNTNWTMYPATVAANYRVAVLPVAESGNVVKLRILKAWLNDFVAQNDGELSVTIKKGFRSVADGKLYINGEDKTYNLDTADNSWKLDGEEEEKVCNILSVSKGSVVETGDYANVGINLANCGNAGSIGYHFSELKAAFPDATPNIFVNGKSVYQINEEYDGSYTYSEFPATVGRAYQDPVYLQVDGSILWVKIAKPYFRTLPVDFNVTIGENFGYTLDGEDYKMGETVEYTVEKSGLNTGKWLPEYSSSSDFGISVFANNTSPDGYQSFNMVYSAPVSGLASIGYDSGNTVYYAMQERIFINGKSVAAINAETSTGGYSFNYFPASAIDSFKLPVVIFVSDNNIELKINSAYYDTVKDNFSVVIKPDFFVVVGGVRYCMPDGFTYIANKAKRTPKLLGGTTEYVNIEMDADFFALAPVGTVFSPVGGDTVLRIREAGGTVSAFGALTVQKGNNNIYRINLMNTNVVDGAVLTLDAAYMNGTDIEHIGPAAFVYHNGWYNLLTSTATGATHSIVGNNTFDNSIDGWSLSVDTDTAELTGDGFSDNGIKISHTAGSGAHTNTLVSSAFNVEKGVTYRVFAHVMADGKVSFGGAFKNGNTVIDSEDAFAVLRDGSDGWKLLEYRFTAKQSGTASLAFDMQFADTAATVVFDDIIVCSDFAKGDIDGDGNINLHDLLRYKKAAAEIAVPADAAAADLNGDSYNNVQDMSLLAKLLLGQDIKGYTYTKMSVGTALYFGSSDSELDTFLNDFFDRHTGTNNSTALRPGEIGYADTAWKAWEAQSLLWYDSTSANYKTDKFGYMRDWLYGTPIDTYGYTWSSFNNLEDPATDPSGVFGMGWPFPNYGAYKDYDWEFNAGNKDGWKVTGAVSNTVANGYFSATVSSASEVVYSKTSLSSFISTSNSPFLELDLRWALNSAAVDDIIVSWKTSAISNNYKSVSVKDYSIMEQSFGKDYAQHIYLPMYLNENWGNNKEIYGLKITVKAKAGATLSGNINLNFVRGNLDTRQVDNAYNLLETAKLYQEYTGDLKTLRDNLNRYRSAVAFMAYNLADSDGLIDLSNFEGHDGGIITDGRAHTIASSYWDLISLPKKSVYAQALYYKSLCDLMYLETAAADAGITVEADTVRCFDGMARECKFTVEQLNGMANTVKSAVQQTVNTTAKTGYYDTAKGRFIDGFNIEGNVVDFGSVIFNDMVVSFGMATDEQAASVISWISGERTVEGDNSTGSDIYAYIFAPRTTTVKNSTQYVADYSSAEANAEFGTYCQDGGAILFTSYYDIMARLAYAGTEDAYARLSDIKDWYLEVLEAYNNNGGAYDMRNFFRGYYADKGVVLQGDGTSGALGLDKEFIENTILCSVIPNGFFGISATDGTLNVAPSLPEELSFWRMENLMFRGVKYDLEIGKDYVILESVSGNTYGLALNVQIKTDKVNPKVYVNGMELDSTQYTVSGGVVTVNTSFAAKMIEVK